MTPERFALLARWAAQDLAVGRLVEGHTDALAILAEAGTVARPGATYGVWAARSGDAALRACPHGQGWQLFGDKPFCSGASLVSRSLITASAPDGYRLFDLETTRPGISVIDDSWVGIGMAGAPSPTVSFDGVLVDASEAVGDPGFYLERPGFWAGAVGVGACWYGGGRGLVDELISSLRPGSPDPVLADLGLAVSSVRAQRAVLDAAGAAIDLDPEDRRGTGRFRALAARQAVHDGCVEILRLVAAAGGARPLAHNPAQARRTSDLYVYLSQHHGGPEAAELGKWALGADPWS